MAAEFRLAHTDTFRIRSGVARLAVLGYIDPIRADRLIQPMQESLPFEQERELPDGR
jgi:hypothetical protein